MIGAAQYAPAGRNAREIVGAVEDDLREGRVRPGERLPPVRALAGALGVSPATVAAAYRQLRERGVVVADGRRGTTVSRRPPLAHHLPSVLPPGTRDLASGHPDPELLPAWPERTPSTRLYGMAPVAPRLEKLARRQFEEEGVDAGNLCVVSGALDGVERTLAAWLRAGDRVAVEDPGYQAVHDVVGALGLEALPVDVDELGMVPTALAAALERGAAAVVITPRAQNPTGAAFDAARATQLRRVLDAHPGALVVEDDHSGPIAGAGLHTMTAGRQRWVSIRSVSKSLGPDLRLAVLAGDEATAGRVQGRQAVGPGWVSYVLQLLVADLWTSASAKRSLRAARKTYGERRAALVEALARRGIVASARSGLNVWVPVAEEEPVVQGLLAKGWATAPGARFRIASPPAVRITTARLLPADADTVAADLADCLRAPWAGRTA